jgi:hypothetical protein
VEVLLLDEIVELSVLGAAGSGDLEPGGFAPAVGLQLGPEDLPDVD